MPADIWPAVSGSKYANGNEMFFNQDVAFYMSGSWNTANVQQNVGDKFDFAVVPVPCGPAGCGIMPGGQGLVAFKSGDAEKEEAAAKFVDWMAADEQAREWAARTFAIPANSRLQAEGSGLCRCRRVRGDCQWPERVHRNGRCGSGTDATSVSYAGQRQQQFVLQRHDQVSGQRAERRTDAGRGAGEDRGGRDGQVIRPERIHQG